MNIFDRYYKKYDIWYDRNKFAYLSELEAIKKVIPSVGRGLEIGVGTGRFAAALNITIGIDPSHNMIEIASRRGVNVRWGFGEDLPFLEFSKAQSHSPGSYQKEVLQGSCVPMQSLLLHMQN